MRRTRRAKHTLNGEPSDSTRGRVLHVLSADLPRGAQTFARSLVDAMSDGPFDHRVLTVFASSSNVLEADARLDVPPGMLRSIGFDPRAWFALRREVRRVRPDVVVAHGGEVMKYLAGTVPGSRTVYKKIGTSASELSARPLARKAFGYLARRANVVVAVSDDVASELANLFRVPRDRIRIVMNGRDPSVFHPPEFLAARTPLIGFIGELNASKRPMAFLDLVASLRARGLGFDAVLVGDGPLRESVAERASDLGVAFLGERHDVPKVLRSLDVLVFPGRPPEGMPGVLIEAALSAVPVVTTDVPGAATVVHDERTGFVVPVDDDDQLVDRCATLLENSALRSHLGAAARSHAVRLFSIERCADEYTAAIESVLATNAKGLARAPRTRSATPIRR